MFRKNIASKSVILLTCVAVVLAAGVAFADNTGTMATVDAKFTSPKGYAGLVSKAGKTGGVRVIVGVNGKFATDSAPAGTDTPSQRAAIAGAQDLVLSELAAKKASPVSFYKYKYIPYMAMRVNAAALQALASSSGVSTIQEDVPARVSASESWSMEKIGASDLHSADVTGTGMSVAVIDTGVDGTHPYLSGAVVSEACYSGDYTDTEGTYISVCPGRATDLTTTGSAMPYSGACPAGECDHGTHVAGIVAGRDNVPGSPGPGVAPGANIIAVQVFTLFDSEFYCGVGSSPCLLSWIEDRLKGLERIYELRNTYTIAAVNISLSDNEYTGRGPCEADNKAAKAIIDNLKRAGIATIASSGVHGLCGSVGSPACISSVISVGATDSDDLVADYSNSAPFLTLFAPGSGITSSIPGKGYETWNGTSMAAPHVAGAWALAKQRRPGASVVDILKSFTSTGQSVTDSKCPNVTKKRINVYEAYNYPRPTITASPASLNFGSVKLGEASPAKILTIKNTGPAGCSLLDISSMTIDPGEFSFSPAGCPPLARGESCALSVQLTPSATYGSRTGTLVIDSDAPNKPSLTVKLSGNAVAPKISVPATLSFPAVEPPGALVKSVVVKNTGISDLVIGVITKTGDRFAIGPTNTCGGATVAKGGSCTIDVTFTPAGKEKYAGSLAIPSNDAGKPTATVTLKGEGK